MQGNVQGCAGAENLWFESEAKRLRLHFAGVDRPSFLDSLWQNGARSILISYADYHKSFPTFSKHLEKYDFKILLDSGAYSAFTRNLKLNVYEYAEFLHRWGDWFERYFNLDVIEDFEGTWNNQDYLEKQNLHPVPVYHYGEPLELVRILARQYNFIGLGGMVPIPDKKLDIWLNDLFYDRQGNPKYQDVNFHGLGLTTPWLLKKYPFYSVDSTTWQVPKKFGEVPTDNGRVKVVEGVDALSESIKWYLGMVAKVGQNQTIIPQMRLF